MTTTEARWAERVRDWRASGKTAEAFAEGQQFEASTLRYWASRLKASTPTAPAEIATAPKNVAAGSTPSSSGTSSQLSGVVDDPDRRGDLRRPRAG